MTLHTDQSDHSYLQSTGHACVLQFDMLFSVGHVAPPRCAGFVILRKRIFTPLPHSSEHIDQLDHPVTLQSGSTTVGKGVGAVVGQTAVLHTRS